MAVRLVKVLVEGSHSDSSASAEVACRRRTKSFPLLNEIASVGRMNTAPGIGAIPETEYRAFACSELVSIARISSRLVPTHKVLPSTEISTLDAPGAEMDACRAGFAADNTSTRFMAPFAT